MRHFILTFLFVAFFAATFSQANAQAPRMFTYQGTITDVSGKIIPDGQHNITVNIYDAIAATTAVFSETQQNIQVKGGVFSINIGSVNTITASVGFNKPYFLGISIDGGAELTRTAISSAPYSLMANGLVGGAVNTVNGLSGNVVLKAGTGTTLDTNGNTLTVNSTVVGGTGIQGVNNIDGSIAVATTNGTATVSVKDGGVTTAKLADASVTAAKISAAAITAGMVLAANGTGGAVWQTGTGGIALPFTGSVTTIPGIAFTVTNLGAGANTLQGVAGEFAVSNVNSNSSALWGTSNGTAASLGVYGNNTGLGRGGYFEVNNPANAATALTGNSQGLGTAILASIVNNVNASNALAAATSGTGRAGFFQINNGASAANTVEATTNGTGNGVVSTTTTGSAVVGNATSAVAVNSGVAGQTASPAGYGVSANYAGAGAGNALLINNGYIKVAGGTKTAYVHTTSAQNQDPLNINSSILAYPGMAQTDIVIVTHVWQQNRINSGYGVWWNGKWEIFTETTPIAQMPVGESFNVLVIKQ